MSKRHVEELIQVYESLFEDFKYAYPHLRADFERDLQRLKDLVATRGIHALCKDLPAAGKHFDRCLAGGEYTRSGLPATSRFRGATTIPKFLRGLLLLVFEVDGRLKDHADDQAVFFIRQAYNLAKKAELPSSDEAISSTVEEFAMVDAELPMPDMVWVDEAPQLEDFQRVYQGFQKSDIYPLPSVDCIPGFTWARVSRYLDEVSNVIASTIGNYNPDEWNFRHGPGVIAEEPGYVDKFQWRQWPRPLEERYPIADCGFYSLGSWAAAEKSWSEELAPSRLIAVPKTFEKPRLIAAEPAAHQWCQQNIWHYFCARVQTSWISSFIAFRDQTRNQMLALEGSRTGDLMTVDLSAASDRLSCHVVGQVFRSNPYLLACLRACRTMVVTQDLTDRVPCRLILRKFSTMGSAVTFPVQTLVFLTFAIASVLLHRKRVVNKREILNLFGEVSVFGDDIIIPSDCGLLFKAVLGAHGFKVNPDKTFGVGNFRESCGVDAFRGTDVSPVYWRRPCTGSPESVSSVLSTARNFYQRFLVNVSNKLTSTIPRGFPMVPADSEVVSIPSFVRPKAQNFKMRWNAKTQRYQVRMRCITASQRTAERTDDSALHQYFTDRPEPTTQWKAGIPQGSATKISSRWVDIDRLNIQF